MSTKTLEIIGDSLSIGQYATYEGLSSWAYYLGSGLKDFDYSISAYSGICLHDRECWGNPRGQTYQWHHTCDSSPRAREIYGSNPPKWDFRAHAAADLVIINLGANDDLNGVLREEFERSYIEHINEVHRIWPQAQIILMACLELSRGSVPSGTTYVQKPQLVQEIQNVYQYFQDLGHDYVHYFDTTGILQQNDIALESHLTDFGNVKIASHLMQWIKGRFGFGMETKGGEILHGTRYWNTESDY
ncbi:hypothetical protein EYZ11_007744 [Aspergillus tanneri]|nr:hypothetical protein EYZ11_007744 [Aspergillus tanneri]